MVKESPVKVFQAATHPAGKMDSPVFIIEDGKLYPTVSHSRAWSDSPEYKMTPDGALYRTQFHPYPIRNLKTL